MDVNERGEERMSGVASRLWGWDQWGWSPLMRQQQQELQHLPMAQSKSLGLSSLSTQAKCDAETPELGRVAAVSISQSVQLSWHQAQTMQGGLHPYLQGICVVFTPPLLTLIPFLRGNFLMLCKESLNHTLKQTQGLTVLATWIWIIRHIVPN